MVDKRGYRKCVRVCIHHNDKVLIGTKYFDGVPVGPEFPGGGIEEGDIIEETVIKECLEEVGIAVTDVKILGIYLRYDVAYKDPERAKRYRGGEDTFCSARFLKMDKKLHGSEGDGLPFKWYTYNEAIALLKAAADNEYKQPRINVVETVFKNLKRTNGSYHW